MSFSMSQFILFNEIIQPVFKMSTCLSKIRATYLWEVNLC